MFLSSDANFTPPAAEREAARVLAAILSDVDDQHYVDEQYYDDEELRAERVFQRPAMNRDSPGKRSRTRPAFAHRP